MSLVPKSTDWPSEDARRASNINSNECVADELYSLPNAVGSESIADYFRIGIYSAKHDFKNHLKGAFREGYRAFEFFY